MRSKETAEEQLKKLYQWVETRGYKKVDGVFKYTPRISIAEQIDLIANLVIERLDKRDRRIINPYGRPVKDDKGEYVYREE